MRSKSSKELLIAGMLVLLGISWFVHQHMPQRNQSAVIGFRQDAPALADGTLIRSARDERVYYMEGNRRRWITSAEVLRAQGFSTATILTLSGDEVGHYQEGEPIELHSLVTLPGERGLLPDIAPLAPYQLRFAKVNGRTVIKFTGSFWNMGGQSFHLIPGKLIVPAVEGEAPVYERITASDGSQRLKLIDNFIYHPAHHHLHLVDFGYYVFTPMRSASGAPVTSAPFVQDKTTFCMRDDERMPSSLPGIPARPVFHECGTEGQGVSVGWIDVYRYTLPDQFVDVQDMPPGIYGLSFMLDPEQHYLEERKDNNIGTTLVQLDVQRGILQVIAMAAPFPTDHNMLPEGMLVRAGGDDKAYVISGGKKRWLRTADVFTSYGNTWENVYVLAEGIVKALPDVRLIRPMGTGDIYLLDDQGRKQHVLSPESLHAQGFREQDAVEVNSVEFDSYPDVTW